MFYKRNSLKIFFLFKTSVITRNKAFRLDCGVYKATYIGQTGRPFLTQVKEHIKVWYTEKENLHLAYTCTLKIIHSTLTFLPNISVAKVKLDCLEALEINKKKNNQQLLNEQTDLNNSSLCELNIMLLSEYL